VTDIRTGIGKMGKPYGSFTLQDYSDSSDSCFFDKDYLETASFFIVGIPACKRKSAEAKIQGGGN